MAARCARSLRVCDHLIDEQVRVFIDRQEVRALPDSNHGPLPGLATREASVGGRCKRLFGGLDDGIECLAVDPHHQRGELLDGVV